MNMKSVDIMSKAMAETIASAIIRGDIKNLSESLQRIEKETILRMMSDVGNNQSEAARRLGISRTALIYKLKRYEEN